MTRRHALITGGAGFIGSHLADTLIERGFAVTVLDDLRDQVHDQIAVDGDGWPLYLNPAARRIRGTVLDGAVVTRALDGVTHLVHLAASVGVGQSMSDIVAYTRNNAVGAATVLQVLREGGHGVRRMAVASSMSIYGEGAYRDPDGMDTAEPTPRTIGRLREKRWELLDARNRPLTPIPTPESKALRPDSVYAINKRDHEEMFLVVGRALDIPTIALRLFNVYGSRQALSNPYTGVAAIFISRLLNDAPPMIFEDGKQRRDFVHVADVANAFATVLQGNDPVWDVFNIGSGRSMDVIDIATTLSHLLGKSIAPEILGRFRVGDIRHCFADIGKARKTFGFNPERDFSSGLAELISWVKTSRKPCDRTATSLAALEHDRLLV